MHPKVKWKWKCAVKVLWFWPAPCPPNVSDPPLMIGNCSRLWRQMAAGSLSVKTVFPLLWWETWQQQKCFPQGQIQFLSRSDWDGRVASGCHVTLQCLWWDQCERTLASSSSFNCDVDLNGSAVILLSSPVEIRNIIWKQWFTHNGNKSGTFRSSSPAVIIKAKVSTAADPRQTFFSS